MTTERRIYKTVGGLACKVEVDGNYNTVKCTDSGVWPLAHPTEPTITVTIGRLVHRRKIKG